MIEQALHELVRLGEGGDRPVLAALEFRLDAFSLEQRGELSGTLKLLSRHVQILERVVLARPLIRRDLLKLSNVTCQTRLAEHANCHIDNGEFFDRKTSDQFLKYGPG